MSAQDLADILRRMYEGAADREKVTMIHLFGIKYSGEIAACGASPSEIVGMAGLQRSYETEVNKARNLARFVTVKPSSAQDLADILRREYEGAADREKVAMIHLFGIEYSDEITACGASPSEIVRMADLPESYGTEVNKARNLARFVTVKR